MTTTPDPSAYLAVETPENVVFGYDVAGIGSRFLAALVDSLIIGFTQLVVALAGYLIVAKVLLPILGDVENLTAWLIGVFGLLAFALLWGYYIFFEMAWNGQSPGKRLAGLRVIRADGTPITLTESIVRNLVRLVDFLPGYYGLGVVVMFIDVRSRRLGDLAAGTLVVRDKGPVTLASVVADSAPPPPTYTATSYTANWPLERLTPADLTLAQDFVRRRAKLTNRGALALRLAQTIAAHLDVPAANVTPGMAEEVLIEIANVRPHTAKPAAPDR